MRKSNAKCQMLIKFDQKSYRPERGDGVTKLVHLRIQVAVEEFLTLAPGVWTSTHGVQRCGVSAMMGHATVSD